MTAILVTEKEILVDCRGSRGPYVNDNCKKFLKLDSSPNTYVIAGQAQKAIDMAVFINTGEWPSPESKQNFIDDDKGITLLELSPEGYVRIVAAKYDEKDDKFRITLESDVLDDKTEKGVIWEIGSGGPVLLGAYLACEGNIDAAFKATSLLRSCCSSNYYRIDRATQKISYKKGIQ